MLPSQGRDEGSTPSTRTRHIFIDISGLDAYFMSEVILASQSPRRRELLGKMGAIFSVQPSRFDERLDEARPVEEVAKELSVGKALDVAQMNPQAYVIGSDTIVGVSGRQMEKPRDIDEARTMLRALAGRESTVSTGIAIVHLEKNVEIVDVNTTRVYFKQDNDETVRLREEYLATNDWLDKAGAYGIQSGAAPLIERIDGDYDTVVGLPTRLLSEKLRELGIEAVPVVENSPFSQV